MKMIQRMVLAFASLSLLAGIGLEAAPLKIGYSDWPGWTAWEIAKVKGFFKKHGVEVELVWFPVYTDSLTALNTGKIDGNCQTWSDTMAPLSEGIPLKVVLVNDNSFGNDGLVAAPGIKSIKDLKGKTVTTELGTCDHFLLLQALAKNGMTEKDIQYKNLAVPDAAAAFISGKVEAAVIWQPWLSQVQREGKGKLLFSSAEMPGLIPDLLVFQESVVKSRSAEIQKVVSAWFDVVSYVKHHEEDAVKIMAKLVEQKPEDYKVFLPGTKFFDLKANLKAFEKRSDDHSLVGSGKTISEFLKATDSIKKIPDFEAALDPTFVKGVTK